MTTVAPEPATILAHVPPTLCASCVGRVFAKWKAAPSNAERGRTLRPGAPDTTDACPLCEGLPARVDLYAELCRGAAQDFEYDSFLVGTVSHREIRQREDQLYETLAVQAPVLRHEAKEGEAAAPAIAWAEYLKAELNREVGKRLERLLGRVVDFQRPHVTFEVDTRLDHVRLRVAPAYVQGRYRKHDRGLPQTRWPCRFCGGLGCRKCDYRGKTYAESVEELVARPFLEASGASEEAFHGMGREDIDARMLGTGRPFVLELKAPRRRHLDWARVAPRVRETSGGRVEALDVSEADSGTPQRFKAADPDKTYVARCSAATPLEGSRLEGALEQLQGIALEQRTPERVAHRRADLVRRRRVHRTRLLAHEGADFTIEVLAEAGTYIKEFVSGDEGRTRPSLAAALGVEAHVVELDVVDVAWPDPAMVPERSATTGPTAGL